MKVVVIRPEPGNAATVRAGREQALDMVAMPLFRVEPIAWTVPDGQFDGLLIGSANALRHGGSHLPSLVNLPIHAVGEATAQLARQLGFHVGSVGVGGLQQVVDAMAAGAPVRLLRLAGEEHLPLQLPANVQIDTAIVYRVAALHLGERDSEVLAGPACVTLHSAAAARHFASECERLSIEKHAVHVAALGPRIAKAAGAGWASMGSASEPNDAALLAFVAKLCQKQDK